MTLINNKNFILDDEENESRESDYVVTPIVTRKPNSITLGQSIVVSTLLHPLTIGLIWIITIALALMGIQLDMFNKFKVQPKRDIEFVLVDKPAPPRDPNTRNRADINSRSGGKNDPKRKVSMPSPAPQKQQKAQKASSATKSANKLIKKQQQQIQKNIAKKQQTQQKAVQKQVAQPSNNTKPTPAKPAPPTARPSAKPLSAPTPAIKPSTPFNVPVPKGAPVGKTLATGPVGGGTSGGSGTSKGGSSSGSGYAPRPTLAPTSGGGSRGSSGQLGRSGSGGGNGTGSNPGGGGGAPGIDAIREPDFGPYMRDLQRRIKLNWNPPKGNESKTVVLLFKIAKDGRLLSCRVQKSSGFAPADREALKAVELTAPFRPLPADFKGQNIDIQFTFDYRVFGASRY